MRYNIYSAVHKYIRGILIDFSSLVGKADFSNTTQLENVRKHFTLVKQVMEGHANHEDASFHKLLREKGSLKFNEVEESHVKHHQALSALDGELKSIEESLEANEQIEKGYKFYLNYTRFVSESLLHLLDEETTLMKEFWYYYSDEELQNEIVKEFYSSGNVESIVNMFNMLFPYMDANDRRSYFSDLAKGFDKENVIKIFESISTLLSEEEKITLKNLILENQLSLADLSIKFSNVFQAQMPQINSNNSDEASKVVNPLKFNLV